MLSVKLQGGRPSREEVLLQRGLEAARVADTVGDGTCDLETDAKTVRALGQLGRHSRDLGIKRILLDLPAYKPKPRRQHRSQAVEQRVVKLSGQASGVDNTNLLGCLLPHSNPEEDDFKGWPKHISEKDTALI